MANATDNRTTEIPPTATDELRQLLDERGVEYEAYRDIKNRCITKWRTYHGAFVFFAVEKEGKLFVETASGTDHSAICTPEQAIAVTLGGGECELVYGENDDGVDGWYTHCGGWFAATRKDGRMVRPRFCQLCGNKVVKR